MIGFGVIEMPVAECKAAQVEKAAIVYDYEEVYNYS